VDTVTDQSDFKAKILDKLPDYERTIRKLRELILANLVMIGEIPSPTFNEENRSQFLKRRFAEVGLQNCSTDEAGNVLGILPGSLGKRNILLVAHTDTVFSEKIDHTISVGPNEVVGPGVADNSLGLSVIASLPDILDRLGIQLKSNLVLMGAAQSLGRGNLEGLRFFLSNTEIPIHYGVCVEGAEIGRLSYSSVGMLRGEIVCMVPEEHDWTRMSYTNAIITLNEVISNIVSIPLPKRPITSIVLGSIRGGHSFNTIATTAALRFEVRSESEKIVREISERLEEIIAEVSAHSSIEVNMDVVAVRKPGGIKFSHPLCKTSREIMKSLDIETNIIPSISELSALIYKEIPSITIGMTNSEHLRQPNESIYIFPIYRGIAQLIGILTSIDEGFCDAD